MEMEDMKPTDQLSKFLESGIYRFDNSNAVFIDPVRVLSRSYTTFRVSPSAYYSRLFESKHADQARKDKISRKRKRKQKKPHVLNVREEISDQRHQRVRPLLMEAHESLLGANDLLAVVRNLREDFYSSDSKSKESGKDSWTGVKQSFVELGRVWQAPLFEITLGPKRRNKPDSSAGDAINQCNEDRVLPLFNCLVGNMSSYDAEAKVLDREFIIPRESCFYMSDLGQINNLIPADSGCGYNLIIIDPPWENGSAYQKSMYQTLPNRYFLSLPIKQLIHREGALLALWVTNREKLLNFVEKELFPAWGVRFAATFYWLKVKADGSLISDLDLFHHRPYERLLLGYCDGVGMNSERLSKVRPIKDNQVITSIPGDYSRKPPIGDLLLEHVPGLKPPRCIELFAREMMAGWVSWATHGNLMDEEVKKYAMLILKG